MRVIILKIPVRGHPPLYKTYQLKGPYPQNTWQEAIKIESPPFLFRNQEGLLKTRNFSIFKEPFLGAINQDCHVGIETDLGSRKVTTQDWARWLMADAAIGSIGIHVMKGIIHDLRIWIDECLRQPARKENSRKVINCYTNLTTSTNGLGFNSTPRVFQHSCTSPTFLTACPKIGAKIWWNY